MNTEIMQKAQELKALIDRARDESGAFKFDQSLLQEIEQRESELAVLTASARAEQALNAEKRRDAPTYMIASPESPQSLGEQFIALDSFKSLGSSDWSRPEHLEVDLKTLFQRSAGWPPQAVRTDTVALYPTRPLSVLDVLPTGETDQSAVVYMAEDAWANAATEVAEGATFPQATFTLTQQTATVQKIAVYLPVTDEQLEDVPRARDYIDNRLTTSLQLRLDSQVLVGDGVAPNLLGILNVSGVQTQAKGTDTVLDAIFKGITKVRHTGFSEPTAMILHPNDWQDIRLTKVTTGYEQYVWGSPAEAGLVTIFGVPVIVTPAITENTGLVGAFMPHAELVYRRGIDIQVGYDSDNFTKGIKTIRADVRVAMVVYRPQAFCKVTGI